MKCIRCGKDYIGMKKVNKFNCPHCGKNLGMNELKRVNE
jgi:DNA-directed RNA polymerase subunit RPC12/RpoP